MPEAAAAHERDDESTRDRLIEAATEVFAERGYDGTRVHEIARRAGLTTGAIYANFSGKAALLLSVIQDEGAQELDGLLHRPADPSRPLLDQLVDLGVSLAERGDPVRSALLFEAFAATRRDGDVARFLRKEMEDRAELLRIVAERIRREEDLSREVDAEAFIRFCHSLVLGGLVFDTLGFPPPSEDGWRALLTRVANSLRHDNGERP